MTGLSNADLKARLDGQGMIRGPSYPTIDVYTPKQPHSQRLAEPKDKAQFLAPYTLLTL